MNLPQKRPRDQERTFRVYFKTLPPVIWFLIQPVGKGNRDVIDAKCEAKSIQRGLKPCAIGLQPGFF